MYHTIVTLKKGEGRTIKSGGAWIYDNEIDTITGRFHNGDMVTVHDFDGYGLGKWFHQPEFQDPHPHDDQKIRPGSR